MGGAASCYGDSSVDKSLPSYHIKSVIVTEADVAVARNSWELILNDCCDEHKQMKLKSTDEAFLNSTSLTWFYDLFYEHLFEIHPSSKSLFRGSIKKQGLVLVKIITISLGLREDRDGKATKLLTGIAKTHAERGIRAYEYGIAGDCLFWALCKCLGPDIYNESLRVSWIRIYSLMLDVLVPAALIEEGKLLEGDHRKSYLDRDGDVDSLRQLVKNLAPEPTTHETATVEHP